jgi:hypothetical protein
MVTGTEGRMAAMIATGDNNCSRDHVIGASCSLFSSLPSPDVGDPENVPEETCQIVRTEASHIIVTPTPIGIAKQLDSSRSFIT